MRATDLLRLDHERVHQLFLTLEQSAAGEERRRLLNQITDELEVHAQVEEELFYPAVAQASRRVEDARAQHRHARRLIGEVKGRDPGGKDFMTAARILKQAVLIHVAEEEGGMFLDAAGLGAEALEGLGGQIAERKQALKASLSERGAGAGKKAPRQVA